MYYSKEYRQAEKVWDRIFYIRNILGFILMFLGAVLIVYFHSFIGIIVSIVGMIEMANGWTVWMDITKKGDFCSDYEDRHGGKL